MTQPQKQPVTITSLRQRLEQIRVASMLQKPALIEQTVSEAVTLAEQQQKDIDYVTTLCVEQTKQIGFLLDAKQDHADRLAGLEKINGVL